MPYELDLKLVSKTGKPLYVFVFFRVVSELIIKNKPTALGPDANFGWRDYPILEEIICYDTEENLYIPTPEDKAIWEDTIEEAILETFQKRAA